MSKTVTARTTPKRVQIAGDLSTSAFTTLARATYHQVGLYGMREILRHIEAACVAEILPDGETSDETIYRQKAADAVEQARLADCKMSQRSMHRANGKAHPRT